MMLLLKNNPKKLAPAPICQCECRACDIGIHCGKQNCEHNRPTRSANQTRPTPSASVLSLPTPRKTTETLLVCTLPFESAECSSHTVGHHRTSLPRPWLLSLSY